MKFNQLYNRYFTESADLSDHYSNYLKTDKTILFTDIASSSKLWKLNDKKMMEGLDLHESQILNTLDYYDALIIKSIGDSFMIAFNHFHEAISYSIDLQKNMSVNRIYVEDNPLQIRIGISGGELYEKLTERQDKKLIDYFGCIVNIASRMESSVSEVNGVAFSYLYDDTPTFDFLNEYKIDKIDYKFDCDIEPHDRYRSDRLLTNVHDYYCKDAEELGGVKELTAYKIAL